MKQKIENTKDLSEKFFEIENDLDLYNLKINNILIWDWVRRSVYSKLKKELKIQKITSNTTPSSLSSLFYLIINTFISITFKNPYFGKQKEVLFFGHPRKKIGDDSKWTDIYSDEIIKNISISATYWEKPYNFRHLRSTKLGKIKYLDFVYLIGGVFERLLSGYIKFPPEDNEIIDKIEDEVYTYFNIRLKFRRILARAIIKRKIHKYFFRKLLRKIKPKLVILVVSYEKETFIEVCKELGIKTIELQHGIIDKYHLGYSYPNNGIKRTFPDYFFTFGDFWNEVVEFPIEKDKVVSVGYPYFEKESSKYKNSKKKKQILFLSQGTIGKELSKFAVEFISKKSELDYEVVYKLHPGECLSWKEDYPWLLKEYKKDGIKVIDENITPLYKLMAESKILVGVYSTAIYEGLVFNPKIYLFNTSGIEYMENLIGTGYAKKINTVEDLLKAIENDSEDEKKNSKTSFFFKESSIENIKAAINKVLAKKINNEISIVHKCPQT